MGAVVVDLGTRLLEQWLRLPDGVSITGVAFDSVQRVLRVRVDGPGLPACGEGCVPVGADLLMPADADRGSSEIVPLS